MTLDEYQQATERTANDRSLAYLALGIAGEAGEVADIAKKVIGQGHTLDRAKMINELGDVLWYIARLARDQLGVSLSEVAQANIDKLKKRYPDGFSTMQSIKRTIEK